MSLCYMCFNLLFAVMFDGNICSGGTIIQLLAHLLLLHLLSAQPWRLFPCIFLHFILCLSISLSCFTINCTACLSVCAFNLWDGSQSIRSCLPPQLQLFVSQFCITIYIHFLSCCKFPFPGYQHRKLLQFLLLSLC